MRRPDHLWRLLRRLQAEDSLQCWLCDRPAAGARIYFRVLERAMVAPACDQHRTEVILAA